MLGIKFWVEISFFFFSQPEKEYALLIWPPWFVMKNVLSFLLTCFFSSHFQKFIMGLQYFFILLKIHSAFGVHRFMSLAKFVDISVTISLCIFSAIPPFSTPFRSFSVLSFVIAPQVPKAPFTFFQSTFFLLF